MELIDRMYGDFLAAFRARSPLFSNSTGVHLLDSGLKLVRVALSEHSWIEVEFRESDDVPDEERVADVWSVSLVTKSKDGDLYVLPLEYQLGQSTAAVLQCVDIVGSLVTVISKAENLI